jgi:hypothetical protein
MVTTTLRTLAYPTGWPDPRLTGGEKPREKDIDVLWPSTSG